MSISRIRPLSGLDLPEAARIHREAFGAEAWDLKAIQDVLAMPGAAGLMAVDAVLGDRRCLGFALYLRVADDAELLTVGVRHDARRQGVGTGLLEAFLHRAQMTGASNAFLEVAEDNVAAQYLYARHGFRLEGMRQNYYRRPGNRRVAARLLRRSIAPAPPAHSE